MREIGLRTIARLCEQAYDKADAVLLDVYNLSAQDQPLSKGDQGVHDLWDDAGVK